MFSQQIFFVSSAVLFSHTNLLYVRSHPILFHDVRNDFLDEDRRLVHKRRNAEYVISTLPHSRESLVGEKKFFPSIEEH